MLNHLLAEIVALGSLVLFLSGFLLPEVQRKPDLAWSGVALLYALLLYADGDRTSGGALLGNIASAALILWFGWQTLQQRRACVTPESQTEIPGSLDTLIPFLKEGWGRILGTYGEASAWVQDQMGKAEESLPEVKTSPVPLEEVDDEDWENSSASAPPALESPSVETLEASSPHPLVQEPPAISTAVPSDPAAPLIVESTHESSESGETPSGSEIEPPLEPESSSAQEPTAIPTPEESIQSDPEPQIESQLVADPPTEPESSIEPELLTTNITTEQNPTETVEASPNSPEPETVYEVMSIEEPEQDIPNDPKNETIQDDGSWPPHDPLA